MNRDQPHVLAAFLSDRSREGDITSARNQREPTISQRTATFRASVPSRTTSFTKSYDFVYQVVRLRAESECIATVRCHGESHGQLGMDDDEVDLSYLYTDLDDDEPRSVSPIGETADDRDEENHLDRQASPTSDVNADSGMHSEDELGSDDDKKPSRVVWPLPPLSAQGAASVLYCEDDPAIGSDEALLVLDPGCAPKRRGIHTKAL